MIAPKVKHMRTENMLWSKTNIAAVSIIINILGHTYTFLTENLINERIMIPADAAVHPMNTSFRGCGKLSILSVMKNFARIPKIVRVIKGMIL